MLRSRNSWGWILSPNTIDVELNFVNKALLQKLEIKSTKYPSLRSCCHKAWREKKWQTPWEQSVSPHSFKKWCEESRSRHCLVQQFSDRKDHRPPNCGSGTGSGRHHSKRTWQKRGLRTGQTWLPRSEYSVQTGSSVLKFTLSERLVQ